MLAWHFAREGNALGYGDNRVITLGETLTVDAARVKPCAYGLHASASAFDALQYAAGPMLWRVELGGVIVPHGEPIDKYAASERTAVAGGGDASEMLRAFARWCALEVIHLWDAPQIVREYLETGDESKRAAAWAAAREAARAAAGEAAGAAARAAAWEAAGAAAREAARAAARAAAWEAMLLRQREKFEEMALAFVGSEVTR